MISIGLGHDAFTSVRASGERTKSSERFFVAIGAILAYGIGGLYLLDQQFRVFNESRRIDRGRVLRLLFLLRPVGYFSGDRQRVLLIESVRLLSLTSAAVFIAAVLLVPVVRTKPGRERATALEIIRRWATGSLAHFTLLGDKSWSIVPEGLVSYHLTGRVASARWTDRFGAWPRPRNRTLRGGVRRQRVDPGVPSGLRRRSDRPHTCGYSMQYIGSDAVVDLDSFSLDGHHRKRIRSTLRSLERTGHSVAELAQPLDDGTMVELRAVSDSWLSVRVDRVSAHSRSVSSTPTT